MIRNWTRKAEIRLAAGFAALAIALSMAAPAAAQYPQKPIRVVVPFGPGGATDLTARAFQKAIADDKLLPQPITIVNVTGGAVGSVGARNVLSSPPDGYTFLIHHLGMLSSGAAGTHDFSYKDFEPVAATTDACHVLVVGKDSPYKSMRELLDAAKAKPDSITYGVNLGGNFHMVGLMMEELVPGAKLRIVQIGGEAENVTAIKGGIIDSTTLSTGTYTRYQAEGLKALADFAPKREPTIPEVPTAAEQGLDISFCVKHWWFAPKGTPKEAIDTFAAALKKAMDNAALKKFFESRATLLTYDAGDSMKADLDNAYRKIAPVAVRATKK